MSDVGKALCHFAAIGGTLLANFVADRPEHDRWMVAIAVNHRYQVALRPIVKKATVAVLCFSDPRTTAIGLLPFVERFIHHDEAHFIGQFQQFGRRRIVRSSNRIAAHLLEQFQLPLQGPVIYRRAERSQIVMVANAVHWQPFAVQMEAVVFGEFKRAEAERIGDRINSVCRRSKDL